MKFKAEMTAQMIFRAVYFAVAQHLFFTLGLHTSCSTIFEHSNLNGSGGAMNVFKDIRNERNYMFIN